MNGASPHASRNAELVHVDIASPLSPSVAGYDHFVTMLNVSSRVCAIVAMKCRKPTLGLSKKFVSRLETELEETMRFIRPDNDPELINVALSG